MCVTSCSCLLEDTEVSLYMGYYGGHITVCNNYYSIHSKNESLDDQGYSCISKVDMIIKLSQYSSQELAQLIINLVDNASEE